MMTFLKVTITDNMS